MTGFKEKGADKMSYAEGDIFINIALDNSNEEMMYQAFGVDGNEAIAEQSIQKGRSVD